MADEVQGRVTGGNGERLSFQVGSKSFGLQTKDMVTVLLLISGLVGGYLIFVNMKDALMRLIAGQDKLETVLQDNRLQMRDAVHLIQESLADHRRTIRRMLETHEYNQNRDPQDRLPLEVEPPRGGAVPLGPR